MRKLLFSLSFILILSSISIISYKVVSADTEIKKIKDIIEQQEAKEKYITPYGYTIENPNIILNPYGNSPLTALILFETPTEEKITIMLKEKDNTIKIKNTFKENTKHYIPVYGLYPNYNNEIIITYKNITKHYTIKTKELPTDFSIEPVINKNNEFSFLNTNGYLYALDQQNEVRWYLTNKYNYNITKLTNGNFIIPTSNLNNNKYPLGIKEIDLLGKVYKQYNIENGYYGAFIEKDTSYIVLSKNLIEIDKQTGEIIKELKLKDRYNILSFNKDTNIINLQNSKTTLSIDLTTDEKNYSETKEIITPKEVITPIYTINNYILKKGINFKINEKTPESKKKIYTIGYKKIDENYKKYNIKISKEANYLKIIGNFKNEETYIILDKFLDKRIYEIKDDSTIINTKALKGKYSIYIKIKNDIYKTNKYIKI